MMMIKTIAEILSKKYSCKVALITGSFDLLHPGHLHLFKQAKLLAPDAKLLVLVMDDANISRRKGPERPVQKLLQRIAQLEKVPEIDYLLTWTEPWEHIAAFVSELQPAYFIAVAGDPGAESKRKTIEAGGGQFIEIQKLPGFSTTEILAKQS